MTTEQRDTRVRDIMTPQPAAVAADTSLLEAFELMERKKIRHLPVVKDGRLVGLLSERHVRDAMPSILTLSDAGARRRALAATRVDRVWIHNPATVASDAPVLDAIRMMRRLRAGSLPVVDGTHLVGILTSGDLITFLERILLGL